MIKPRETYCPLGVLIDTERRNLGVSVVDFCRLTRISKKSYYKVLRGKTW